MFPIFRGKDHLIQDRYLNNLWLWENNKAKEDNLKAKIKWKWNNSVPR